MNRFFAPTALVILLAIMPASAQHIIVEPDTLRSSIIGAKAYFSGHVIIDMYFTPTANTVGSSAHVSFSPGARTAWHSHPAGQHLLVTSGTGWVQAWGEKPQQIKAGDVVWTPPGVKHWHGATESNAMRHIAMQEAVDGSPVEWMEHVSDEQYQQAN